MRPNRPRPAFGRPSKPYNNTQAPMQQTNQGFGSTMNRPMRPQSNPPNNFQRAAPRGPVPMRPRPHRPVNNRHPSQGVPVSRKMQSQPQQGQYTQPPLHASNQFHPNMPARQAQNLNTTKVPPTAPQRQSPFGQHQVPQQQNNIGIPPSSNQLAANTPRPSPPAHSSARGPRNFSNQVAHSAPHQPPQHLQGPPKGFGSQVQSNPSFAPRGPMRPQVRPGAARAQRPRNPTATFGQRPRGAAPQQQQFGRPRATHGMGSVRPRGPSPRAQGHPRPQSHARPQRQVMTAKLDPKSNCHPTIMSSTVNTIPSSNIIAEQSTLPIGVAIHPLATTESKIPEINFGNIGVVRCRRCRAYVNPFVIWIDNGRKWHCNFCSEINETPSAYYRHLDDKQDRVDKDQRAELSSGCVEIFAPSEYMVRPPMPPVYVFCFEVSDESKRTGLLKHAVQSIRENIDSLPGSPRTQVGFIGYDQAVHVYVASPGRDSPQVISLPDLSDLFLPLPEDLLVNLSDSREQIEKLLNSLEELAVSAPEQPPQVEEQVSLGGALNAAYNIMAHIGGRLAVFASKLPLLPPGNLAPRGNVNVLGTMSEHSLLRPNQGSLPTSNKKGSPTVATFYKLKANDFSRQQICCDIFSLPVPHQASYVDLASLSEVTKFTGGDLYYYGGNPLNVAHDRLRADIKRYISREVAWEAVMRVRASEGLVPKGFYGNFLLRGNDLMALPCVSADSAFLVEFSYDTKQGSQGNPGVPMRKDLAGPVTIQTALLYTNSQGERRIRVATIALPISKSVVEVLNSASLPPIVNLYGRKGVDISFKAGFDDFKRKLQNKLVELIRAYRSYNSNIPASGQNQNAPPNQSGSPDVQTTELLPGSLNDFPKYVMGIMKSQAFRGGNEVVLDARSFIFDVLFRMGNSYSLRIFSPTLTDLVSGKTIAPSQSSLRQDGVFVLDTCLSTFIWAGSAVPQKTLVDVFGIASIANLEESQLSGFMIQQKLKRDTLTGLRKRLFELLDTFGGPNNSFPTSGLLVVKEGAGYLDHLFRSLLWYDRQQFSGGTMSYQEFLVFLSQQAQGSMTRKMRR